MKRRAESGRSRPIRCVVGYNLRGRSELAELDRQICEEAAEIKDLQSFTDRAKGLDEKARKLNEEVNQEILTS